MTIAELGAVGEFVGSIAVLITLIYLAIQIRQNTKSMEEGQRLAKVTALVQRNDVIERTQVAGALSSEITEIKLRALEEGVDSLTKVERSQLNQWELARIFRIESQFVQWENGYLEDDFFDWGLRRIVMLNAPLWKDLGLNIGNPRFHAAIDKIVEESDT